MQKNVQRHLAYITLPLAAALLGLILLNAFHGFRARRTGFPVHVASDTCSCGDRNDRVIFLHVSAGGLTINSENVDRKILADRLSDIYRLRAEKVLYLSADDDVPFQAVADVVDTVQHLPEKTSLGVPLPRGLEKSPGKMSVVVELVTRRAQDALCHANCFNLAKQAFPVDQ